MFLRCCHLCSSTYQFLFRASSHNVLLPRCLWYGHRPKTVPFAHVAAGYLTLANTCTQHCLCPKLGAALLVIMLQPLWALSEVAPCADLWVSMSVGARIALQRTNFATVLMSMLELLLHRRFAAGCLWHHRFALILCAKSFAFQPLNADQLPGALKRGRRLQGGPRAREKKANRHAQQLVPRGT